MRKLIIIIAAVFYLVPLMAQDRMEERRERIENLKIAFITKELDLTTAESQEFWPLYNTYQNKVHELRKEIRPDNNVTDMSENDADELINKYFQVEHEKLKLEEKFFKDLRPVIGPKRTIKLKRTEEVFKRRVLEKLGDRKAKNSSRGGFRN